MNAWISPEGEIHEITAAGHKTFATDFIMKNVGEQDNPVEYLMNLGWMRIMNWDKIKSFIVNDGCRFTQRQKDSLFDLCLKYDDELYKDYL